MPSLKQQLEGIVIPPKREPRRIYFRPMSRPHAQQKIELDKKPKKEPKTCRCKVCFKVRPREEMKRIGGGGTQGHREYFICPGCA